MTGGDPTTVLNWSCTPAPLLQTLTITAPTTKSMTDAPFAVSAVSSVSALTAGISLTVAPSNVCTYANGLVTPRGEGTCVVTASSAGNGTYGAATQTANVAIVRAGQTLTISAPNKVFLADGPFAISAQSSAPATITLSTAPSSICTYANGTVTPVAAGDCVITANATGTTTHLAASASKTVSIVKKNDVSVQLVAKLSVTRVQTIISNQMGSSRQIDRLMDFRTSGEGGGGNGAGSASAPAAGFSPEEKRALDVATNGASTPRLGFGLGMSENRNGMPLASQLGARSPTDDDLNSPMRTRGPHYGTDNGGGMSVAGLNLFGSGDGGAFNFSTSLRDVTRAAQAQEDARLKDDPAAAAMGFTGARARALDKRANPLDVWVEGRFLRLNDGRNGADLSGYSGLFGTGVDYVFNKSLLAGVSLSYDVSGQKSSANSTEARGTGWLVGPYATVRLSPQVFWQSRAAWGRASNDVSPNLTVTDSFGSTRWLVSSKLTGRHQMGAWQLRPSAGIAYMEETSDGYRSGTGANVDSIKTRVGTASAGPEISYQYRMSPTVLIEPRAGIEAIWSFARDISVGGNSALVNGEAVGPGGVRGRAELGLRTLITGGTVIDLSGAYDGIGAGDYNTVTGRAVVRVPLN